MTNTRTNAWCAVPAALALIVPPMLLLGGGCTGMIGAPPEPDAVVATLTLTADERAALVSPDCASPHDCRLPNPELCATLAIQIRGDGSTIGRCTRKDGSVVTLLGGDGIPLTCRSHTERFAVHCLDANNNVVLDATEGSAALYPARAPAWYRPSIGRVGGADTAWLPDDEPGDTPGGGSAGASPPPAGQPAPPSAKDQACRKQAIARLGQAFQRVLHQEGFTGVVYSPGPVPDTSGFYSGGGYQSHAADHCKVQRPACKKPTHWSQWLGGGGTWYGGGCYCSVTSYGPACYTALMITAAKAEACGKRPPDCDARIWGAAVQDAVVPAKKWADNSNKDTDTKAGVMEGIKAGMSLAQLLGSLRGFGGVRSYGSPLVLDLRGDGLALTTAADGVRFDLTGAGPVRTAWVAGEDDALLAMDLDGDGRIDSGAELFGEGSRVAGFDGNGAGFDVLARLDRAAHGGNENGLVEAGDLLFDQLLLWRDADRDGRCAPGELRPLRDAGVRALCTVPRSTAPELDPHGNDVGTRGTFLRNDGTAGALVDVYFLSR